MILGAAGRISGTLGALVERSWSLLEGSWEALASILEVFGRYFGDILELGRSL